MCRYGCVYVFSTTTLLTRLRLLLFLSLVVVKGMPQPCFSTLQVCIRHCEGFGFYFLIFTLELSGFKSVIWQISSVVR